MILSSYNGTWDVERTLEKLVPPILLASLVFFQHPRTVITR